MGAALLAICGLASCATTTESGSEVISTSDTSADSPTPSVDDAPATATEHDITTPSMAPDTAPPADGDTEATTATSEPDDCDPDQPLVDSVEWVTRDGADALRVIPNDALRDCGIRAPDALGWNQVIEAAPDADSPAMRQQYDCHVRFAWMQDEWHLEPWRPEVSQTELIAARCNPEPAP